MKVIVVKDYEQMSDKAFEIMKQVVVNNPNAVLGLATGTTPIGLYKRMIEDFCANIDEALERAKSIVETAAASN